jgi:hypothetical protein
MILHWEQLRLYYGAELGQHRWRFERAHNTTYGLLCCRLARGDDRLAASSGDHAETRLLQCDLWCEDVPAALDTWTERNDPIVTTMVLNRSPCRNCAAALETALNAVHNRFALGGEKNRFVLACLGKYWGSGPGALTLIPDLRRLKESGWELCVLQMGTELSARGAELEEDLQRLVGRGFVRLG